MIYLKEFWQESDKGCKSVFKKNGGHIEGNVN